MSPAVSETVSGAPPQTAGRVGLAGMWTFLATDAMGFGALFIAYGVLRVRASTWPDPRARLALLPVAAMTVALLTSSFTMTLACGARTGRTRARWLVATIALGLAFLAGALFEYRHLWTSADSTRIGGDLFGSTFYVLTGYHGVHVLAGLVCLSAAGLRRAGQRTLEVVALYWHFVDLAWMPIFTFLYLLPAR